MSTKNTTGNEIHIGRFADILMGRWFKRSFCYSLRNLESLEERPAPVEKSELLSCLFDSAEIANFTAEERTKYINDMTTKRDIINQIAYAKKEGHAAGVAEGEARGEAKLVAEKEAIARDFRDMGISPEQISKATGLSVEAIVAL